MKFETYSEHDPETVSLLDRAFLTVWGGLGAWHDDLVLVGGLVPKFICSDVSADGTLPRPVTIDADFGISLGAECRYGNLELDLHAQGFHRTTENPGGTRYVKTIGNITIRLFIRRKPPLRGVGLPDGPPARSRDFGLENGVGA